ncbi:MAG: hypothetical protein LBG92_00480 [Prevotellaceae bacterium]|nr:hypothetical protein [Prevotellaceae bacterium]
MKIKVLFLISAFLLSGMVYAQNRPNRQGQGQRMSTEERAKAQADRLKKELDLTTVQYDSVTAIQLRQAKKMEALRNQSSGNNGDMRSVFQKNQEELNKEYKKLFTADQYKKYEEMIKNRQNRGGDGNRRQRNAN